MLTLSPSGFPSTVRIPSGLTALYSLKPSFGRFPTHNARTALAGQEAVKSVNGPMSLDFSSLELFAKAVVNKEPWRLDPQCLPMPWKGESDVRKTLPKGKERLVIGVIHNNGMVRPLPSVQRALAATIKVLQDQGHEIVE